MAICCLSSSVTFFICRERTGVCIEAIGIIRGIHRFLRFITYLKSIKRRNWNMKEYYIKTKEGNIPVTEEIYYAYFKPKWQERYKTEKRLKKEVSYDLLNEVGVYVELSSLHFFGVYLLLLSFDFQYISVMALNTLSFASSFNSPPANKPPTSSNSFLASLFPRVKYFCAASWIKLSSSFIRSSIVVFNTLHSLFKMATSLG